jgi:hypothetical protein
VEPIRKIIDGDRSGLAEHCGELGDLSCEIIDDRLVMAEAQPCVAECCPLAGQALELVEAGLDGLGAAA